MGNLVPKGWAYPKLKDVVKYQKGKKPKVLEDEPFPNSEPYLDIKAFEKDEIRRYADVDSSHLIHEKEIGIVWDGARSGWVGMNKKGAVGSTIAILRPLMINEIYLFRFLESKFNYINENTRGSGIPHVDPQVLWDIDFPLPPRAEQDRIVAKVDALMAQHAAIQQAMERIPQLLKNFRQQVLTQAVTGKLTEEWRVGKELEEWAELNLIDVIKGKPRNGYSPRAVDYITGIKSLSLGATTSGIFDATKIKYLDIEKPEENSHLWLKHGDILIQRSNSLEYVGTSAIYTGKTNDFVYPDIMMKVQANDKVLNIFLNYSLSSYTTKEYYKQNASGTAGNMPKINQIIVSNTPILLPPLQEQQEIVRRVESLFEKATAIEQRYEQLKTQIFTLPQSILHKAFKGELVEQLDSDGSAMELLEEIEGLKREKKNSVS
jgi:type I restriction enzyme S subunit